MRSDGVTERSVMEQGDEVKVLFNLVENWKLSRSLVDIQTGV